MTGGFTRARSSLTPLSLLRFVFLVCKATLPETVQNMQCREVITDKLSAARAPFALLVFVVTSAFAKSPAPEVIFVSPCVCQGFHGKHRWIAKTDLTPVPLDKSALQSITPSQIYAWEGIAPDGDIKGMVEARMPSSPIARCACCSDGI